MMEQASTRTRAGFKRSLCMLLAVLMIVSLFPVTALADGPSLTTDKTEYVYGDPIMVTASGGNWVGLYPKNQDPATDHTSYYWYNVSAHDGVPFNILEGTCNSVATAGEYKIILFEDGEYDKYLETIYITITEPTEDPDMALNKTVYEVGQDIMVTIKNAPAASWCAIFGKDDPLDTNHYYYYVEGNGTYNFYGGSQNKITCYRLPVGEYKAVLFGDGGYGSVLATKYFTVHKTVSEDFPNPYLATDKTEYNDGQAIKVTAKTDFGVADWVGIHKKGEDPSTNKAIYWFNTDEMPETVVMQFTDSRNKRTSEFTPGEYTIRLFANGGYDARLSVDITIYPEEQSRVVVNPTCTEGGYTEITYVDGSKRQVEPTNPLGHDYTDVAYLQETEGYETNHQHSRACTRCGEKLVEDCVKNEGQVIKEATEEEFGEMKYTCTLCSGTWNEQISKKEVARVERTEPTCTEPGNERTWYTDGTYLDRPIPALNHDWGEWTYNEADHTHTHICKNDAEHTETAACTFEASESQGVVTHECTVCHGKYTETLLSTDKTEYELNEPIMVTAATGNWIGLYGKDENPVGGPQSIYWFNFSDMGGAPYNMLNGTNNRTLTPGEYKVLLFNSGGFDKVIARVDITIKEAEVPPLSTDKDTYAYGEPIMVTTNFSAPSAWVALYKKGEVPSNTVASIFWYYLSEVESYDSYDPETGAVDIVKTRDENNRSDEFVAGEYTVYLIGSGNYTPVVATKDIVITKEEVSRTAVEPTCTEQGYTLIKYSDGTEEKIDFVDASGHDWNDWAPDAATYEQGYDRTHSRSCKNNAEHTETAACTFGEGVVTKEATAEEDGVMTYTCSVCGGTYTEVISKKEVDRVERTEPTCTEPGNERTWYTDGTYTDKAIPPKGHDWGEWTYNEVDHTHTHTCKNDSTHTETAACTFEASESEGVITHACTVCEGSYSETVLSTNKDVYDINEPILVTTGDFSSDENAWVGIYKKGDNYENGTVKSIFWYYLTEKPNPTNILTTRDENGRSGEYGAGEFVVILFANGQQPNGGYDWYHYVASKTVKVEKTEVSRETVAPTCTEEGYTLITYSDGSTEKVDIKPALGHDWSAWSPDAASYENHIFKHTRSCSHADHPETGDCTFDEGVVTKEPTAKETGEKTFTCSVCGGSYVEILPKLDAVVDHEEVIKEATCTEPGTLRTWYTDGSYIDSDIPAKGHEWGEWIFNEEEHTHSRTCKNDPSHIETEDCTFESVIGEDGVTFTCTVCGGSYSAPLLDTDKDEYVTGDPIMVSAYSDDPNAWVGLYKAGDSYGDPAEGGHVVSIYWYYLSKNANPADLVEADTNNPDRNNRQSEFGEGDFILILFAGGDLADGGYDWYHVAATKNIKVTKADTSKTVFDMMLNGELYADGAHPNFPKGTSFTVTATADGPAGDSWVGFYKKLVTAQVDFSANPSNYWYNISKHNGEAMSLDVSKTMAGDYSLVLFADGGYNDIRKVINFTVLHDETDIDHIDRSKEPTCDEPGLETVYYNDGSEPEMRLVPALGHEWGEWTFNEQTHEHTHVCTRDNNHTETEACVFEDEVIREATETTNGLVRHTCTVCGGFYEEAIPATGTDVLRIYGNTRYQTSFKLADTMKQRLGIEKFDYIVVASGTGFADALGGSYLAGKLNAPILVVNEDLAPDVVAYVAENLSATGTAYLLGGEKAVPAVVASLMEEAGVSYERLFGPTRYETNLEILKKAGVSDEDILVCNGLGFADSLSASAVGLPILLVGDELTDVQMDYLATLKTKTFYMIGGENAISAQMEETFSGFGATVRLGGNTRYETSVLVADTFFGDVDAAVLAYSLNYPDGLCGAPVAMGLGGPLLLVKDEEAAPAAAYAEKRGVKYGYVLGGETLISDETAREVFHLGPEIIIKEVQ